MSEINYQSVKKYIQERLTSSFDSVYLIYGEEYLYKQVVSWLLDAIIPDQSRQKHNYDIVRQKDGGQLGDVIERMNTFSIFSGKNIIELRDTTIFVSSHNPGKTLQKVKQFYEKNETSKAAGLFLDVLSRLCLDFDDLTDATIADQLKIGTDQLHDLEWIKKLIIYCQENNLLIPKVSDDAELLQKTIKHGFPKSNYLFISTDTVDKRKGLYKTIKKFGTVINCSVPTGNRKSDRDEQRRLMLHHMQQLSGKHQKQVNPQAFELMVKMTGFNLRVFSSNLEKLIDYVGDREMITVPDVQAVLKKTRQDPIYELTGAISERNTLKTLHFLSSLLSSGFHYLQILTAITNQIRRMLVVKGFLESPYGKDWQAGMSYDRFKNITIPSVCKYDKVLVEHLEEQKKIFTVKIETQTSEKKQTSSTDIIIAKNPNNPYPIYQMFIRSETFSKKELFKAFEILNQADVRLKTTGQSPRFILEEVVLNICRKVD